MLGPPQERLVAALPRRDGGSSQATILDALRTVILDGVARAVDLAAVDTGRIASLGRAAVGRVLSGAA